MRVFIGPYIKCKQELVTIKEEVQGCPKCNVYRGVTSFCHTCGTPVGKIKQTRTTEKVNYWDITENEELTVIHCNPYDHENIYYIANKETHGVISRNYDSDSCDVSIENIDGGRIDSEFNNYVHELDNELRRLKNAYGPENVSVHWGILVHEDQ